MNSARQIMSHQGANHGPLLIVLAGVHGNEHAGIKALTLVEKMLEVEPITNPSFDFKGKVLGLYGNLAACRSGVRYHQQDLNRMWIPSIVDRVMSSDPGSLEYEELEMHGIMSTILEEIHSYQPSHVVVLDLHTTSSTGGIFALPSKDQKSLEIALELQAPVITDILKDISGTTLHYFTNDRMSGVELTAVTFEAGQHDDPTSIKRCIAAIVNCMRTIGCVRDEDVENIHDDRLRSYSAQYPKRSKTIYRHSIQPDDYFVMRPGYQNFDEISEGEHLADDRYGPILAKCSGRILMPLYQKQGEDGFYVIQDISEYIEA